MKKFKICLYKGFCLIFLFFFKLNVSAQVGVGLLEPKATLEVQSFPNQTNYADGILAPRLTAAQLKAKDNAYTSNQDGVIVYVSSALAPNETSNKTLNVLERGYYYYDSTKGIAGQWIRMYNHYAEVLHGANGLDTYTGSPVVVTSNHTSSVRSPVLTRTFTLKHRSLVNVKFSLSFSNLRTVSNTAYTNDKSIQLVAGVWFTSTGGGGVYDATSAIVGDRQSISGTAAGGLTGTFYLKGNNYVSMPAGTYTVELSGFLITGNFEEPDIRMDLGAGNDILDIVAYPIAN